MIPTLSSSGRVSSSTSIGGAPSVPDGESDLIIHDGGDVTLLGHESLKTENEIVKSGEMHRPKMDSADGPLESRGCGPAAKSFFIHSGSENKLSVECNSSVIVEAENMIYDA